MNIRPSHSSQRSGCSSCAQQRQAEVAGACGEPADQRLQIVLGDDEQRRADHRAIKRAHAADDHDDEHVDLDREAQRRVGPDVAQPERVERARRRRARRGDAGRERAMEHDAIAQRLGAKRILADRLQHAPERRIDDAQQREEQRPRQREHQIIGEHAAVDRDAERTRRA